MAIIPRFTRRLLKVQSLKSEYENVENVQKSRFRALCSQMEKFIFFYALILFFKKIEISISEFENGQK